MNYLILGGAGFIGSNLADRLLSEGETVVIADNFSRRGSIHNLHWLRNKHPQLQYTHLDVRHRIDLQNVLAAYGPFDVVVHLAAQVAVTTSVTDPQSDFTINALGTFNVLEALRQCDNEPILLFASTNKVYGGMEQNGIIEKKTRYEYESLKDGIDESFPLDFHSPYGCSKGCADQYVRDYARIYGLKTVVFRQSAIYGPRQFGIEDQGWAAWFTIAALKKTPITIFGDGKQVRDLLWVNDLVDVYKRAVDRIDRAAGEVYNIGGGAEHSVSIWNEFGPMLEKELGETLAISKDGWRPGDQKVCVMNCAKAQSHLDWTPKTGVEEGIKQLVEWVRKNLAIL